MLPFAATALSSNPITKTASARDLDVAMVMLIRFSTRIRKERTQKHVTQAETHKIAMAMWTMSFSVMTSSFNPTTKNANAKHHGAAITI